MNNYFQIHFVGCIMAIQGPDYRQIGLRGHWKVPQIHNSRGGRIGRGKNWIFCDCIARLRSGVVVPILPISEEI